MPFIPLSPYEGAGASPFDRLLNAGTNLLLGLADDERDTNVSIFGDVTTGRAPRTLRPNGDPREIAAAACDLSSAFRRTACGNDRPQAHVRCNPSTGRVQWFAPVEPKGFKFKYKSLTGSRRRGCR